MRRAAALTAIAGLSLAASGAAGRSTLRARFLGNAGVEVTDGEKTLLVDFPYRSGAFGCMTYSRREIAARPDALCLFTHAHADHFAPDLVAIVGCTVVGPEPVVSGVRGNRTLPLRARLELPPITILPVATPHGTSPHDSYRIEWGGRRLYFTGDTGSVSELRGQGPLDLLFITPWLLARARRENAMPRVDRIVVYHHRSGEQVRGCSGTCLVPQKGDVVTIPVEAR